MRIVDLPTLLTMPQGTLYQKWKPCYFEEMSIFDNSLGNDFVSCEFGSCPIETHSSEDFGDKCDDMAENGASYPVGFEGYARDGCFVSDQLFAVWEPDDVRALIAKLEEGLAQGIEAATAGETA